MSGKPPAPGAVAIIAGRSGRSPERIVEAAVTVFEDRGGTPELFQDGPLAIALADGPSRALHVSDTTACLLDGAVYTLDRTDTSEMSAAATARLIAEAYERRGDEMVAGVRGEFWALVWNRVDRTGLVVTDQMGSRTPYWTRADGELAVASEVPELLAALSKRPDPDGVGLAHWLMLTAPPHGTTLFAGVHKLEAGHVLDLKAGEPGAEDREPRRYWSPAYVTPMSAPREELVAALRESLATAVRRRVGDGRHVGVLLSGGLDSSTVAAVAASLGHQLPAYSATFPGHSSIDESALMDATVEQLRMPSTRIVVRAGSVLAGALSYIAYWQLPPTSPNLFFWDPLLERAAADGTRVMLDGEGGDELFGLSPYLLADRLRHGRVFSATQLARGWPPPFHAESARRVWIRVRRFGLKGAMPPVAHLAMRRFRNLSHYTPPWLNQDLGRAWLESEDSALAWKRLEGPRWWRYLLFGVTRGIGPALVYEQSRRRAAVAGIDARHPLVDPDVIELMLRLPPELAFDARFSRPLLREAVAGLLPEEVRTRPFKSNFDAMFHEALAGRDLPVVRRLLSDPRAALREYVDLEAIYRLWLADDPPRDATSRGPWAIRVWRMVTAECWLRAQQDPQFIDDFVESTNLASGEFELVANRAIPG